MKLSDIYDPPKPLAPRWVPPQLSVEYEEMERTSKELHIPLRVLTKAFNNGELVELTDEMWSEMRNTESWQVSDEDMRALVKNPDKDDAIIRKGYDAESVLPAPIVLKDVSPYLIAGNSRLMIASERGLTPKVWLIDLPPKYTT